MPDPDNINPYVFPVIPPVNVSVPLPEEFIVPPPEVKLITLFDELPAPVYLKVPFPEISIVPFAVVVGAPNELDPFRF
jgi:hypothetical protein